MSLSVILHPLIECFPPLLPTQHARTAPILLTVMHVLSQFPLESDRIILLVALDDLIHAEYVDHVVEGLVQALDLREVHKVTLLAVLNKDDD